MITEVSGRLMTEAMEASTLVPYATTAASSLGRVHLETDIDCSLRTAFQRDVGRVTHSAAFRRLQYKTQFYPCVSDDCCRTRLAHTLAVSQIARTIARALRANEDLTEAIALVHDVGHAPFGHVGEDVLNEFMIEEGGFEHNLNGLRVVDLLEARASDYRGLNLTFEVREGLARHRTEHDSPDTPVEFLKWPSPSIESQIVDIADSIAYRSHDLEDGLLLGLITGRELDSEALELWRIVSAGLDDSRNTGDAAVVSSRRLINELVLDVVSATRLRIGQIDMANTDEIRSFGSPVVDYSDAIRRYDAHLSEYMLRRLYRHPYVLEQRKGIEEVLRTLLDSALADPCEFGVSYSAGRERFGLRDVVASMTDRAVLHWYAQRLPGRWSRLSRLFGLV